MAYTTHWILWSVPNKWIPTSSDWWLSQGPWSGYHSINIRCRCHTLLGSNLRNVRYPDSSKQRQRSIFHRSQVQDAYGRKWYQTPEDHSTPSASKLQQLHENVNKGHTLCTYTRKAMDQTSSQVLIELSNNPSHDNGVHLSHTTLQQSAFRRCRRMIRTHNPRWGKTLMRREEPESDH